MRQIWNSELKLSEWNFAHQFRQVWNREKNLERSESRSVSPPAQDWAAAERAGNDRLLTIWTRTPECPDLTMPGKKNQGRKRTCKPRRGKARDTHAIVIGRQEKGAGSDLGAVFGSLLLGSWLGQSPPLLPLPQDHFVLSPLLPCQCSYVCIKWTNHPGGTNVWLCWKVQKTLINGDAIKLNQKSILMLYTLTVLFVAISQHIWSSFDIKTQQKSLVLVTFSLPLANHYSTCTKEEAE